MSASSLRSLAPGTLVVLVGAAGSGKSTWATEFASETGARVVSTDELRALVGDGESDQRASRDAFALLDDILRRRLKRRLTTVVDSTALESDFRMSLVALASAAGVPAAAVLFRATTALCLERNASRARVVPQEVVRGQARAARELTVEALAAEGFAHVVEVSSKARRVANDVRVVSSRPDAERQSDKDSPLDEPAAAGPATGMRIELVISRYAWPGGASEIRARLFDIVRVAEEVGVSGVWLMDHYRQIPQVGQAWEDLPELISTLGFLAAATSTMRIGSLVASISARSIAQLARSMATLDVLSGGRMVCGIGAGWFEEEAAAVGDPMPKRGHRFELLEDALQALPLFFGKGAPSIEGKHVRIPSAMSYPRPLQNPLPILVGGGGNRTLSLAARYANAVNLQGTAEKIEERLAFLRSKLAEAGRATEEVEITHLGTMLLGSDHADLSARVAAGRGRVGEQQYRQSTNAGTIEEHATRLDALRALGVTTAIVAMVDLQGPDDVRRLAPLIDRMRASG